jgi:hypothetical protein
MSRNISDLPSQLRSSGGQSNIGLTHASEMGQYHYDLSQIDILPKFETKIINDNSDRDLSHDNKVGNAIEK